MKKQILLFALIFLCLIPQALPVMRTPDTTFSGNFVVPEQQSGFQAEQYEIQVAGKVRRGATNFFLCFLEIPHGIKTQIEKRKADYLPVGVETVFIGFFNGLLNTVGRAGIGLYEIVTFPYPQPPILEDMDQWLY